VRHRAQPPNARPNIITMTMNTHDQAVSCHIALPSVIQATMRVTTWYGASAVPGAESCEIACLPSHDEDGLVVLPANSSGRRTGPEPAAQATRVAMTKAREASRTEPSTRAARSSSSKHAEMVRTARSA
jgi:hypothetical protein